MALFIRDPFDALLNLQKALASSRSAEWFGPSTSSMGVYPPVNVFQQGEDLVIVAEMPGVRREDLEIEVKDNRLRISGTKSISYEDGASPHRRERVAGSFDRTIAIPVAIDAAGVKADYKNGILALFLPRAERDKPRAVPIN
jgi:HSP20 family protein